MPDSTDTYLIGVTRFSLLLPNSSQWKLSAQAESQRSYAEALYDPARLDSRLRIFSELSLPQLAAGSAGRNYRHIVQHSSTLPEKYQTALNDLAERYDFLTILCSDDSRAHADSVVNGFRDMVAEEERPHARLGWFRLDDDDIVSDRYFERVSGYVETDPPGRVVSLGLGYSMIYSDDRLWDLRSDYRPKNSIGQLYLCAFGEGGQTLIEPPRQNHAIIDQFAPTILDSRHPSFITVVHPLQDGRAHLDLDSALAAVEKEQGIKDIKALDELEAEFSHVLHAGVIAEGFREVISDPPELSTEPVRLPVSARGPMAIDAEVTAGAPQTEGRVIMGLKFAPGSRPEVAGRWVEIDSNTLAVGFVVSTPVMRFRAHLLGIPETSTLTEVSVWVSRSFEGDIRLDSLTITDDPQGPRPSEAVVPLGVSEGMHIAVGQQV